MASILDDPLVTTNNFFPRKAVSSSSSPPQSQVIITTADDVALYCYFEEVKQSFFQYFLSPKPKTILYFHGNGEVAGKIAYKWNYQLIVAIRGVLRWRI